MALELCKRRTFEPCQPFIRRANPGQNPVKVMQYKTLLNSYGIDRVDRVWPGYDLKVVSGERLGRFDGMPVGFKCS